jgi:hypothetical protein
MTPVILSRRHPYLHSDGVTATVPPNLLTTKIWAHTPPTFIAQGHTGEDMVMARRTSGWRGQKINDLHVSTLQGNCSHRIRLHYHAETTFFLFFSFILPIFHPFTMNITRALPLETIKGEVEATFRAIEKQQLELIPIETTHHAQPLTRDLRFVPSLESL